MTTASDPKADMLLRSKDLQLVCRGFKLNFLKVYIKSGPAVIELIQFSVYDLKYGGKPSSWISENVTFDAAGR